MKSETKTIIRRQATLEGDPVGVVRRTVPNAGVFEAPVFAYVVREGAAQGDSPRQDP